jgi:prepilin-type N-terminal cleavage/methylation domain-containing protein
MKKSRGFTLVELAISLAVIALLLGMMVVPLNTQVDQQRINDTRRQLSVITEALIGFAVANGRLPCPASATLADTAAGAGVEIANCSAGADGVIPWTTLGVNETDAWGRRFTYRVSPAFADSPTGGMQATFTLTDAGTLRVTNGSVDIASNMVAVVVSHGKNGAGAYQTNGSQLSVGTGDELENSDGDNTFVSRSNAPDFDDLVAWLSPALLKTRMVASNRLP